MFVKRFRYEAFHTPSCGVSQVGLGIRSTRTADTAVARNARAVAVREVTVDEEAAPRASARARREDAGGGLMGARRGVSLYSFQQCWMQQDRTTPSAHDGFFDSLLWKDRPLTALGDLARNTSALEDARN
jgi:hypothetical protein